jgi:uncharacterized protein YceK
MKKSLIQFFIFNFSFLILLFTTSGCVSTWTRLVWDDVKLGDPYHPKPPYVAVVYDVEIMGKITSGLVSDENKKVSDDTQESNAKIFPLILLSLPFDIVADTVCLPYDLYSYFSDKKDMWFWEDVLERNDTSLPLKKYQNHLTPIGFDHAKNLLRWDKRGYRDGNLITGRGKMGYQIRKKIPHPKGKISLEMRVFFERLILSSSKFSLPPDFYF